MSPTDRRLVEVVRHRVPGSMVEDVAPCNDAYAAAIRDVYRAHPDDLDVTVLFAEDLMNRTPWQLWDLPSGEPAERADTLEATVVLERAFAEVDGAWDHPGCLHMSIHLMEMSPQPGLALRHGDRLSTAVPDSRHLIHMATHIDVFCGDHQNVVARNSLAIAADRRFLDYAGPEIFYTSTAATTTTSASTGRYSWASPRRRWRRPTS